MNFEWGELAFGSKKPVNSLNAIFIAAPRDISTARFTQLVKTYLPQGNIVLGLAKEPFIDGLDGQPQFTTLQIETVQKIISKVNAASPKNKIYTLSYFQRDFAFILAKLTFAKVVLINGSWKYAFHTQTPYYVLAQNRIDYDMTSPFATEQEAVEYESKVMPRLVHPKGLFSESEMMDFADNIAKRSFDYCFQTGVALGHKKGKKYEFIAQSFNKVVPYQGYAMHFGAAREKNFSPPHDLNHYDTNHAEVMLMIQAQKAGLNLKGTTLFINLLPCPSCARMFAETDISEFVYVQDHSDGYGFKMLELAGKKVRRIVR